MKSVSELGLTTWSELCLSFKKAGFEPQHIHQIINSRDNRIAKSMFKLFESSCSGVVLQLKHEDKAGRVYTFPYTKGIKCADIACVLAHIPVGSRSEEVVRALIQGGMTYSKEKIREIVELSDGVGEKMPAWEKSIHCLWIDCSSCLFFVHNEDKTQVEVISLEDVYLIDGERAVVSKMALDHVIGQNGCEIRGYNYDEDDPNGEELGEYSQIGIFVNVQ